MFVDGIERAKVNEYKQRKAEMAAEQADYLEKTRQHALRVAQKFALVDERATQTSTGWILKTLRGEIHVNSIQNAFGFEDVNYRSKFYGINTHYLSNENQVLLALDRKVETSIFSSLRLWIAFILGLFALVVMLSVTVIPVALALVLAMLPTAIFAFRFSLQKHRCKLAMSETSAPLIL